MKNRYLIYFIIAGIILGNLFGCIIKPSVNAQPEDVQPFDYWYSPNNSFGIESCKELNDTYFQSWFIENTKYRLEGQHPVNETWLNASEYLTQSYDYNNTNNTFKITWTFTSPYTTYYRLKYGINTNVIEYINKSSYEILLKYNVSNNETYDVFFNFSDLKLKIQNGSLIQKHGFKTIDNDTWFWFMITTNNPVPKDKTYVLDPIFGYNIGTGDINVDIPDKFVGTKGIPQFNGIINNITCYMVGVDVDDLAKYVIYNKTLRIVYESWILDGANGTLVSGWNRHEISKTIICYSNETYIIGAISQIAPNQCQIKLDSTAPETSTAGGYKRESMDFDLLENPIVTWDINSTSSSILAYCSYTRTFDNTTPTINSVYPSTNSIDLCPCCLPVNVTVSHANGTFMDIKYEINDSGVWTQVNFIFNDVSNGSYCMLVCEIVKFNTNYWVRITVFNYDDSTKNVSQTLKYTTIDNVNCSAGLTEAQADEIYLSSPIDVEPPILILGLIMFFFYLGNKHEDMFLTWISSLMLFIIGIYYIAQFNTIDAIISVCVIGIGIYGNVLSWKFLQVAKLKKKQKEEG